MKFTSCILGLFFFSLATPSLGQEIDTDELLATWKYVPEELETTNDEVTIELGMDDEFEGVLDSILPNAEDKSEKTTNSKPIASDEPPLNLHVKFENGYLIEYLFGDAFIYLYTKSGKTIRLGDYDLEIVELSEEILILKGEVELKFQRVKTVPEVNRLFSDKAPIRGAYNPLILFSYPSD